MIKVPESWIVQGDFEPESGYRAMQQILSQSHRPTAVFCGGDIMAMGALCAADEMGLRVPQDVSLIGYDNVRNARYFTPALTTIHQPKDSLGETAFNMLLDRIVNKREEPQSIEVHPRLIERRPWLTARSATIVVNTRCGSLFRLPQPPLFSVSPSPRYSSNRVNAGDISFCCHVRQHAESGRGFPVLVLPTSPH